MGGKAIGDVLQIDRGDRTQIDGTCVVLFERANVPRLK